MQPWDNERERLHLRDAWERALADVNDQEAKARAAQAAGRPGAVGYEMNADQRAADAYIYGHISDAFRSREELVRVLESLEPPPPGTYRLFDYARFERLFRAKIDALLKTYRETP